MSTIVYQGTLQSCFESQIIETTTLKLKVPTPSTIEFGRGPCLIENNTENLQEKCQNKPSSSNLDLGGGWSSIQTLSNISKEDGSIYVHPLSKRSSYSSRLSAKSLELCTESLGSETGSCDIMDSSIFSSSFSYSPSSTSKVEHKMTAESSLSSSSTWSTNCNNKSRSKKNSCTKFPPPLTTIRGSNSLQFRPHREDGRLIIKAVESPLTHNYLQAERSNGRLRLCFYKDGISNFEENEVTENDNEREEMEEEKLEEEEEKEEESDVYNVKWDIEGNNFEVEGEMGMEKCQSWLSRCKEGGQGNKVFCDWRKPLWVATS